jgi:hypothetical protein
MKGADMKVLQAILSGIGALLLFGACGSGDSDGEGAPNPPANIDLESCSDLSETSGFVSDECAGCCVEHGFSSASIYDEHCICGSSRDQSGASACANQAPVADACTTCCTQAGYTGHSFSGGASGGICTCSGRSDSEICASYTTGSDPGKSCQTCCLNYGYLGYVYSDLGTAECECSEP